MGGLVSIVSYSRPSLMIIALRTQFHINSVSNVKAVSSRFQPGEGPSRGLLRDCTTLPINRLQHYTLTPGASAAAPPSACWALPLSCLEYLDSSMLLEVAIVKKSLGMCWSSSVAITVVTLSLAGPLLPTLSVSAPSSSLAPCVSGRELKLRTQSTIDRVLRRLRLLLNRYFFILLKVSFACFLLSLLFLHLPTLSSRPGTSSYVR